MAVYKDRAKVPVKETWDLDSLLDKKSVDERLKESLTLADALLKDLPTRYKSVTSFLKFLEGVEKFEKIISPAFQFLSLSCAQDTLSPLNNKMAEVQMRMHPYSVAFAAVNAEDIKNQATIGKYLKDDRLARWRPGYEHLFMKASHLLPENLARYRAAIGQSLNDNETIFTTLTDAEIKYEPALDSKGKKHEVSQQTITTLLREEDRVLRKNASASFAKGWLKYKETLSSLLAGDFLANFRLSQTVKYANQIEQSMDQDNAKPDLVLALYDAVKLNMAHYRRYSKATRAFVAAKLKLPFAKVEPYDVAIELVGARKVYTVAEAISLVSSSTGLLGKEYENKVKNALKDRWVDFHMTPNKMSGAFSSGIYESPKKMILMNFDGHFRSVETLAHEMGHSMHSAYNHAANDQQNAGYPLFIAEVASIFSELMLTEHILKSEKDETIRFRTLDSLVSNFTACVYTQLEMSEYEYKLVERLAKNDPASDWMAMSKLYEEVRKPYVCNPDWAKKYGEEMLSRAVTVPHYYMNFYVYKYALGMIGALNLMSQVKHNPAKGVANYIKFVESGRQQWPLDILKSVGVDMLDQKVLKSAFDQYASYLDEYIAIGKKLLKVKAKL